MVCRAGAGSEEQLTSWQVLVWRYFWLPSRFPVPTTARGTLGRTLHSQLGDSRDRAVWSFHRHLEISENGLVTVSCVFFQKVPSLYTNVRGWMCEGTREYTCECVCVCGVVSVFLVKSTIRLLIPQLTIRPHVNKFVVSGKYRKLRTNGTNSIRSCFLPAWLPFFPPLILNPNLDSHSWASCLGFLRARITYVHFYARLLCLPKHAQNFQHNAYLIVQCCLSQAKYRILYWKWEGSLEWPYGYMLIPPVSEKKKKNASRSIILKSGNMGKHFVRQTALFRSLPIYLRHLSMPLWVCLNLLGRFRVIQTKNKGKYIEPLSSCWTSWTLPISCYCK